MATEIVEESERNQLARDLERLASKVGDDAAAMSYGEHRAFARGRSQGLFEAAALVRSPPVKGKV